VLGTTLGYGIGFILLGPILGPALLIFSLLPVIIAALMFGLPAGLLAGLLAVALNALLMYLLHTADWFGMLPGQITVIAVGGTCGWIRVSVDQLRMQPHRSIKKRARPRVRDEERDSSDEASLRESRQMLHLVIDTIPQFIVWKDRHFTYLGCNRNFAQMAGATHPADVVGKKSDDFKWHRDDAELIHSIERNVMNNDQAEHRTLDLHLRGHDTRTWLDAKFVPLHDTHGHVVGILSTYQDVTARKQAEEEIARTRDRALSASRFKSDLLAKVSHDLRTPLNAIIGFAELLENGAYGPVTDAQREALENIIESSEALTGQVNELLDQSQLEAGTLKLKLMPFSPAQLVQRTQASMYVLAESKGLDLDCEVAAGLPESLMGDQQRLQQILTNLVGNAIKFTTKGGVKVRAHQPDEAHWALEVSDSGPGIPPTALPYIFQPFWQVEYSTTRGYTGAGLGLSIVKQLATMMGGAVWVDSHLGEGSVFTVVLPFEPVREKIG